MTKKPKPKKFYDIVSLEDFVPKEYKFDIFKDWISDRYEATQDKLIHVYLEDRIVVEDNKEVLKVLLFLKEEFGPDIYIHYWW